jgi:redox-sensing transcriptional repressor
MVIVGVGKLGRALAGFPWNQRDGFVIDGVFDKSPDVVGQKVGAFIVKDLAELKAFLKKNTPDVGVITTNRLGAQEACDILVEGGAKGIWNFAPVDLELPGGIPLQYVHLNDSLHELVFHISEEEHTPR